MDDIGRGALPVDRFRTPVFLSFIVECVYIEFTIGNKAGESVGADDLSELQAGSIEIFIDQLAQVKLKIKFARVASVFGVLGLQQVWIEVGFCVVADDGSVTTASVGCAEDLLARFVFIERGVRTRDLMVI